MLPPPLYECSKCGKAVEVIPCGEGNEPIKKFKCSHTDAVIWANRTVRLRGKSNMGIVSETKFKIRVTLSQLLSFLTGRSFS